MARLTSDIKKMPLMGDFKTMWQDFLSWFGDYTKEHNYMRGPGPACREKSSSS